MKDYDIVDAIEVIENELIRSMCINFDRHRAEELKEGYNWEQWQAVQLKELELYKKRNAKKYGTKFKSINRQIETLIRTAKEDGKSGQEVKILEAIKKGFKGYHKRSASSMTAEFFKINDRKLEALIEATIKDMEKAETAILRMANDQYRKIIFNAQVYANTGAETYEKAVDMATKNMLAAGLNCVEYKNGSRHTLKDYADMAIRTAGKRAYLQGEGIKRQEWGISTVIMNKRGNPCPKCLPFVGKILIDDVWSGGQADTSGLKYPLMSSAIAAGLYHPRCKDSHTTYFEGISTPGTYFTREEMENLKSDYYKEQKQNYAKRQADKFDRLAEYSIDSLNKKRYKEKQKEWSYLCSDAKDTEQKFLGIAKDITYSWKNTTGKEGTVSDLFEYVHNGERFKVDGKKIILDYTPHEKNVAETIARLYGKEVQMVPRIAYPQNIATPDYLIDDVGWDLKTISTGGKNVLYNAVKKKKRQASRFIFDVTNCPLDTDEINKQINDLFRSTHLTFIDEVGVYKNNEIIGIYKRNKK